MIPTLQYVQLCACMCMYFLSLGALCHLVRALCDDILAHRSTQGGSPDVGMCHYMHVFLLKIASQTYICMCHYVHEFFAENTCTYLKDFGAGMFRYLFAKQMHIPAPKSVGMCKNGQNNAQNNVDLSCSVIWSIVGVACPAWSSGVDKACWSQYFDSSFAYSLL